MTNRSRTANGGDDAARGEQLGRIDSHFRLVVVAALRSKQLLRGARPRVEADPSRRRNASIALEEVRRGLVPFTITGGGDESAAVA